MNHLRTIFIALCLMLSFSLSGAFALMDCGCHDEHASAEETSDCACDCICCAATATAPQSAPDCHSLSPDHSLVFLSPSSDGDTGRLTESFVFTPPRA